MSIQSHNEPEAIKNNQRVRKSAQQRGNGNPKTESVAGMAIATR